MYLVGMALHYTNVQMLAGTCTDEPAHRLACGFGHNRGRPNVTIVTPKIVTLTNGRKLSSNLEENRV